MAANLRAVINHWSQPVSPEMGNEGKNHNCIGQYGKNNNIYNGIKMRMCGQKHKARSTEPTIIHHNTADCVSFCGDPELPGVAPQRFALCVY